MVDIITRIIPFGAGRPRDADGRHRLVQPGPRPAEDAPYTSELTGEELWNLTQMGYAPLRLVLGTRVYALGFAGGIGAFFQSLRAGRGRRGDPAGLRRPRELPRTTSGSRPRSCKADGVIGIKIFIYEIGSGLVEVMAIGTAIRKHAEVATADRAAHPPGDHPRPRHLLRRGASDRGTRALSRGGAGAG